MEELRLLLAGDDLQALRIFSCLRPELELYLGGAGQQLEELINAFALDEALALLDRLTAGTALTGTQQEIL